MTDRVTPKESPKSDLEAPQNSGSFARENCGADLAVESLPDDTIMQELQAIATEIGRTDAQFPALYHRLGQCVKEAEKRFGRATVRQTLRAAGIDKTRICRSRQIASSYTREQVMEFRSLREILRTLPRTQPKTRRKQKAGESASRTQKPLQCHRGTNVDEDREDATASRHGHRDQVPPDATSTDLFDRFVRIGIEVLQKLGEEALHRAIDHINAYPCKPFEDVFEDV